jgi:ABC-type Mn2+/Zn2+ transport system permease subunit
LGNGNQVGKLTVAVIVSLGLLLSMVIMESNRDTEGTIAVGIFPSGSLGFSVVLTGLNITLSGVGKSPFLNI